MPVYFFYKQSTIQLAHYSAHLFSSLIWAYSSGVKSLIMPKVCLISYGVFPEYKKIYLWSWLPLWRNRAQSATWCQGSWLKGATQEVLTGWEGWWSFHPMDQRDPWDCFWEGAFIFQQVRWICSDQSTRWFSWAVATWRWGDIFTINNQCLRSCFWGVETFWLLAHRLRIWSDLTRSVLLCSTLFVDLIERRDAVWKYKLVMKTL